MQTVVNVPDPLYQKSEVLAASRGATVEELIVGAMAKEVQGELESGVSGTYGDSEVELRVIRSGRPGSPDDARVLEETFRAHAERWRQETRILSSIQAKIFNPHYQRIIGMGYAVLPLIFSELRDRGGHWYWALECITGDNPAVDAETLPEAKRLWLEYARSHNYI